MGREWWWPWERSASRTTPWPSVHGGISLRASVNGSGGLPTQMPVQEDASESHGRLSTSLATNKAKQQQQQQQQQLGWLQTVRQSMSGVAGGAGGAAGTAGTTAAAKGRSARRGNWDEVKLWQMGYKQELRRELSAFNNMGCTFSILSFFALVDSYGLYGLAYGGPVEVVWGWVLSSVFSIAIALVMAELISAFPTTGGLYYWSYILAPSKYRALTCWLTGWLNLLGQVAFTASLEYSLVQYVATLVLLHTGGATGGGMVLGLAAKTAIFAGFILLHTAMNCVTLDVTAFCITFSALWHIFATAALCVTLLLVAPQLQPSSWVWGEFTGDDHQQQHQHQGATSPTSSSSYALPPGSAAPPPAPAEFSASLVSVPSPAYSFMVGLLMSQWTIMGFDASVHMIEETRAAEYSGSHAIVWAVGSCCVGGLGLLLTYTYCIQGSYQALFDTDNATGGGHAMAQVAWDVFDARYRSGRGCLPLLYIPLVGLFFCAFTSLTANARMLFAFSRDGAMLGSRVWRRVHGSTQLPVNAAWGMALLAFGLGLPCIYSSQLFDAISSVSVIALMLSYGIPILMRLLHDKYSFIPGPVNMGRATKPLAVVSVLWIITVSVVFLLPRSYPVTADNMNYAPVVLASVLALALALWYLPGVGGASWFGGPNPNQ